LGDNLIGDSLSYSQSGTEFISHSYKQVIGKFKYNTNRVGDNFLR